MREEYDQNPMDFQSNKMTGVYAKFYMFPLKDETASIEAGRPVFVDREFVELIAPGNSTNIIRRKVSDMDRRNFHEAYALFKAGNADQIIGTPLSMWNFIKPSQVEELAYIKCRTVEQLSDLNDQACLGMPGLHDLKRKAAAWLKAATERAPFEALSKENDDLKARISALEESLKLPAKKSA